MCLQPLHPHDAAARLDELELGAWRGFLRAHAALSRELDAELTAAHGLPLSTYEVLLFLADSPDGHMRMSDLADSVLLSRSGLTRLVDRLERDGLVQRARLSGRRARHERGDHRRRAASASPRRARRTWTASGAAT